MGRKFVKGVAEKTKKSKEKIKLLHDFLYRGRKKENVKIYYDL